MSYIAAWCVTTNYIVVYSVPKRHDSTMGDVEMKNTLDRTRCIRSALVAAMVCLLAVLALAFVPKSAFAADMYRLYNPNSGEHFYTASANERNELYVLGWSYEGIGWVAPNAGEDVYRLYNPNAGDHHYTPSAAEREMLLEAGWSDEGVGWKTGGTVPLYRQYNPNAIAGSHNFTTSKDENASLVAAGWREEGIGWYGIGEGRADAIPADVAKRRQEATNAWLKPIDQGGQANADASQGNQSIHPDIVYVTPSGKSFHRTSCSTIAGHSTTGMSYENALHSGKYTACKVCKP